MSEVFKKMNLKAQTEVLVLNAPESFEPELAALTGVGDRSIVEDGRGDEEDDFVAAG